jgi:hypothetical protein
MTHAIFRVVDFRITGPHQLTVTFDDGTSQDIDFFPVLRGELFGPLRDETMFRQVDIDPEAHTLVWPNGADFDPETLHDWPDRAEAMRHLADRWSESERQRV